MASEKSCSIMRIALPIKDAPCRQCEGRSCFRLTIAFIFEQDDYRLSRFADHSG